MMCFLSMDIYIMVFTAVMLLVEVLIIGGAALFLLSCISMYKSGRIRY